MLPLVHKMKRHKQLAGLILLFWLFLYLGTAGNIWYTQVTMQESMKYLKVFLDPLFFWLIAASFVPLIFKITQLLPLGGKWWPSIRNAIIQIAGFVPFIFVFTFVYRVYNVLIYNLSAFWSALSDISVWVNLTLTVGYILCFMYFLMVVGMHLIQFYNRYKQKQVITARLEAELSSANLNVLKNQLRPHFLFNTLHNINSLMHESPADAKKVIELLQRLLSRSFQQTKQQTVPLADELAFTNIYFQIEQIRFYEGIHIRRNIDPQTLDGQVPSLLIQPLAENAVRHGIAQKTTTGTIYIHAAKKDHKLQLTIEDDGPGVASFQSLFDDGIGLRNTRDRLKQMYQEHQFELKRSAYGGLKVFIEIPFSNTELVMN